ncbi:MAG: hypothetical protein H6619_04440 [Deltaproteobacteria bacterium]|nr:hypothetical protein [Deltaproteobacteria bacterium]
MRSYLMPSLEKNATKGKNITQVRSKKVNFGFIISLILLGLIILGLIHKIQETFTQEFLFLTLLSVALLSLHKGSGAKKKLPYFLLTLTLPLFFIGYLSFVVLTGRWDWQPLVISLGYSILLSSITLLNYSLMLLQDSNKLTVKHLHKLYTLCLLGGPMLMASLSILRQLPKNYVLMLVPLFLSPKLLASFQNVLSDEKMKQKKIIESIEKVKIRNTTICALLLLIVALLTSFS